MSKANKLKISKIYEILLIILPISFLFSNLFSEILIFSIIFSIFFLIDKNDLKKEFNNSIFILFLIISSYLILNYFVNIDKNPSISRSFFFIRFPIFAFSIYIILKEFNLNLKKIIIGWLIIFLIISFDIFFQFLNGKNLLGYSSVLQGNFYRLGGFLNDELKIANLIIHFSIPVFVYFHKNMKLNRQNLLTLFFLFIIMVSTVFLTGERSNFISLLIFFLIYLIFTNLRKNLLILIIISIPILFYSIKSYEPNLTNRMVINLYEIFKKNIFEENHNGFLYKKNHYFAHYSTAIQIGQDYPFFGVGMKNFRNFCHLEKYDNKVHPNFRHIKCSTHPHNFHFEVISEIGFLGYLLFVLSFGTIFFKFFKKAFKNRDYFLFGNSIILIINFLPFLPKGSFFTNWNAMIFWTIFGLCIYSYKKV